MKRALLLACAASASAAVDPKGPLVDVPGYGKMEGTVLQGPGGEVQVHAWLGVPYAAAPTGDNRWQPPQDPAPWHGVKQTTKFGNTCMGSKCVDSYLWPWSQDDEDCLFLNIYSPVAKDKSGSDGPFPVMFWIHGGAFDQGCSNLYDGQQLAARAAAQGEPVVVVTINYRLSMFGFLGAEEMRPGNKSVTVGNYGILDQRKALAFAHAHARLFNGDPDRITIFGESAGAGSVTNHLVQKGSFGLYRNAIAQSGFAPTWSSKPMANAESYYNKVKQLTSCDSFACLRKLSTAAMMLAHAQIRALPVDRYTAWAPVVDGVALEEDPETLLRKGQFAPHVNILKGTCRDEFALFMPLRAVGYQAKQDDFSNGVRNYLPDSYTDAWLAELTGLYSTANYTEYPKNDTLGASHWYWAMVRALTDHEFYCPGRRAGRAFAGDSTVSVFSYHLRYSVEYKDALVPHTADLAYVFNCSGAGKQSKAASAKCTFDDTPQEDLAAVMSGYWISFANTNTLPAPWERLRCDAQDTMLVLDVDPAQGGTGLHTTAKYVVPQCEFWDRVLAARSGDVHALPYQPRDPWASPRC